MWGQRKIIKVKYTLIQNRWSNDLEDINAKQYGPLPSFWLCHPACGILVPWPGIEPMHPAMEVWSLNHRTAREVPLLLQWGWGGPGEEWTTRAAALRPLRDYRPKDTDIDLQKSTTSKKKKEVHHLILSWWVIDCSVSPSHFENMDSNFQHFNSKCIHTYVNVCSIINFHMNNCPITLGSKQTFENQTWWLNFLSGWSMNTTFQNKKSSLLIGLVNVSHT